MRAARPSLCKRRARTSATRFGLTSATTAPAIWPYHDKAVGLQLEQSLADWRTTDT